MNVGFLTSTSKRHSYFIKMLSKKVKPVIVICEDKPAFKKTNIANAEDKIFSDVSHSEKIKKGLINSKETFEILKSNRVDICFVFGTSLIKKNILSGIDCEFINIHTGLTQHYRGVDSTLWAIYNNDLDNIGYTIHQIDPGIDTGNILIQGRTIIDIKDNYSDIFMKTCKQSIDCLASNLDKIIAKKIKPKKLKTKGKLYTIKQMNESVYNFLDEKSQHLIVNHVRKNEHKLP
jgi:methionyl-tRNA formyltransferase